MRLLRLSVEQIASGFRADLSAVRRAVDQGVVELDSAGTLSLMLAQALSRFISEEFKEMFGAEVAFLGDGLVYSTDSDFDRGNMAFAGLSLIGSSNLGIVAGGRELFQVESLEALYKAGVTEISEELAEYGFLIRQKNLSEMQALADAYMLGDARVQQAVRDRLLEGPRSTA